MDADQAILRAAVKNILSEEPLHRGEDEERFEGRKGGHSPSELIDARIKELSDWRGETLARVRILIKQADPEVVEEWKWRGVPVWSHAGMICTGESYKNVVKMTFAKGARWRRVCLCDDQRLARGSARPADEELAAEHSGR